MAHTQFAAGERERLSHLLRFPYDVLDAIRPFSFSPPTAIVASTSILVNPILQHESGCAQAQERSSTVPTSTPPCHEMGKVDPHPASARRWHLSSVRPS
jgi:hypothetical protein